MADPHEDDSEAASPEVLERVVSRLGGPDSPSDALAAPPEDLFERIEDATSVPVVTAPMVVEYTIDADDMVVSTGGDWNRFAADNDAEELAERAPRLNLWSQIQGEDAREVWKLVVAEVRRSHSAAKVPFRCDAPGLRRWYEVSVSPREDGSVDFRSELVFEEPRPELSLVARNASRDSDEPPIEVCCWCARGYDGQRWISLDELVWSRAVLEDEPLPEIAQGICGECAESMSSEAGRLSE